MEDTITCILFADNLRYYLAWKFLGIQHFSNIPGLEKFDTHDSKFQDEIGSTILSLITLDKPDMIACSEELLGAEFLPSNKCFTRVTLEALPLFFPEGYSPETFIAYCAMVMGVSLHLYQCNNMDTLDAAAGAVSTTLIGFMLSNEFQEKGGFEELLSVCFQYNNIIIKLNRKAKKKRQKAKKSKEEKTTNECDPLPSE